MLLLLLLLSLVVLCVVQDPSEWNEELFYVFNYDKPIGGMVG